MNYRTLALGAILLCATACQRERTNPKESTSGPLASAAAPLKAARPQSALATRCGDREQPCPAGHYCDYEPGRCGKVINIGQCVPRPAACTSDFAPVCGCDGKVYPNTCSAHQAGVDESLHGGCTSPAPDKIACGPHYCDAKTEYCEIVLSDVPIPPSDFSCQPLPASCRSAKTCDCFPAGTRCKDFCTATDIGDGTSGYRLTCVGGS